MTAHMHPMVAAAVMAAAAATGVSAKALLKTGRRHAHVLTRHAIMYVLNDAGILSSSEIGEAMGVDHATVLYGARMITGILSGPQTAEQKSMRALVQVLQRDALPFATYEHGEGSLVIHGPGFSRLMLVPMYELRLGTSDTRLLKAHAVNIEGGYLLSTKQHSHAWDKELGRALAIEKEFNAYIWLKLKT